MSRRPYIVYDGVCNLCSGAVKLIHLLDKRGLVEYKPYQQLPVNSRESFGLTLNDLQGRMHLILTDGSLASGVFAITRICRMLTPFSALCNVFRTQPAQRLYGWIAQRRYRIFGCRQTCYDVALNQSG